jgi:hypothetical protein
MLSGIMLNVIVLSVIILNVIMLNVIILNAIMPSIIMQNVILQNGIMLGAKGALATEINKLFEKKKFCGFRSWDKIDEDCPHWSMKKWMLCL